jgi:hypothetical protein
LGKMCVNRRTKLPETELFITDGICKTCISTLIDGAGEPQRAFLDSFDGPILMMQPDSRRVRTTNGSARAPCSQKTCLGSSDSGTAKSLTASMPSQKTAADRTNTVRTA